MIEVNRPAAGNALLSGHAGAGTPLVNFGTRVFHYLGTRVFHYFGASILGL
jgi:hypothetical protein